MAGSKWSKPAAAIAVSPSTVLVASETVAEIDWWSFDPGTFDPDGIRSDPDAWFDEDLGVSWFDEDSGGAFSMDARPGPDGIRIDTYAILFGEEVISTNLISWDDLDPEARATYDWSKQHEAEVELRAIDSDGQIATVEWPLGPRSLGGLDWNGNEFIAWSDPENSQHIALSADGYDWRKFDSSYGTGAAVAGTIGDVIFASGNNSIEISTDLGAHFEPIDLDVTDFVISVDGEPTWRNPDWDLPTSQHEFTEAELRNAVKRPAKLKLHRVAWVPPRVHDSVATAVLVTTGTPDVLILSSTDGHKWTKAIVPRSLAANETSDYIADWPRFSTVGPDGTFYVYDDRGVHIGKLID